MDRWQMPTFLSVQVSHHTLSGRSSVSLLGILMH